ncbi:MAG: endo-1,4-beta-xylanase, partial [Promicromonosporaceae bacterium]|nr:endo-1,4-beta-xylanase [Promicromonosporaceae bacterium]
IRRLENHIWNIAASIASEWGPFGSDTNPFTSWEVVNEVIGNAPADPDGLRQSLWATIIGNEGEFIDLAFHAANRYVNGVFHVDGTAENPVGFDHPDRVLLWINDYNTEQNPGKLQRLIDRSIHLVRTGVPIDGMAHQFHVALTLNPENMATALASTTEMNNYLRSQGLRTLVTGVTELDVTLPDANVTRARLIEQGWYYYETFNIFRQWAAENPGDLAYVTVWGLHDGRSWRGDRAPLLFNSRLQAKPAFWGAAGRADMLDPLVLSTDVFGGAPTVADATFDSTDWGSVPSNALTGGAGQFVARHGNNDLILFVGVNTGDALELAYRGQTFVVGRDGAATGGAKARILDGGSSWQAIISLPSEITEGSAAYFDLRVLDGGTVVAGWNTPGSGAMGTLTFMEDLSLTYMVRASRVPVLGEGRDSVWDEAVSNRTDVRQQGSAPADAGARAEFYVLWRDAARQIVERRDGSLSWADAMFVRAYVTDPDLNVADPNPWERDGIEVFLDLGNAKNGSYRAWEDAQIRIEATEVSWDLSDGTPLPGTVTFGSGDTGRQEARVHAVHVEHTDFGYILEVEIGLWFFNEHPSVDNRFSGVDNFHGFDIQVNDATAPANSRTAVWTWANPTTEGWNSTSSWGVIQQVLTAPGDDETPVYNADRLGVRRGNRFFKSFDLVGGNADINFTFGRVGDEVFMGDWNGNGIDTPAIRRGNQFYLTNHQQGGWADTVFTFGRVGDEVFVGDWNGNGVDSFAIRRGNQIFVSNSFVSGPAAEVFAFGRATDELLPGNFDGEPGDTFAVRRGNEIFVNNTLRGGNADYSFTFGRASDDVFVGDWNGSGYDTWSLRRGNEFFKSYSPTANTIDHRFTFGRLGDEVFVGHWGTN